METRYFVIDNTPVVGRVNTFICHASGVKGIVHFFNADIYPERFVIKDIKKYKTEFFIVKLFVKSSELVENRIFPWEPRHPKFYCDEKSIEIIPITIQKRLPTNLVVSMFKFTGFYGDGGSQVINKMHKVIYECLNKNIDISDCCTEMTKSEYQIFCIKNESAINERTREFQKHCNYVEDEDDDEDDDVDDIEDDDKEIIKKFYDSKDGLFHIWYENSYDYKIEKESFFSFDEFYLNCQRNMIDADLINYDFEGINLSKYNFYGARLNSKIEKKLKIYDGEAFEKIKSLEKTIKESDFEKARELTETCPEGYLPITCSFYGLDDVSFFYISDLHLDYKLVKKFSAEANYNELEKYFDDIAIKISDSMPHAWLSKQRAFILGDVSFDFEIFKMFFTALKDHVSCKTYFVLGNHELWDKSLFRQHKSYEKVVETYRDFLQTIKVSLIESELIIFTGVDGYGKEIRLTSKEILNTPDEKLREMFVESPFAFFGGMGFAGCNNDFNSENGLYKDAPITRKFEIEQSNLMSETHSKLKKIVPDKQIIVATHMPFSDWCRDTMVPKWIYISGHTHKNTYLESEEATVYSDNQIGYNGSSFGFKYFTLKPYYNIFDDYPDGVYKISRKQYIDFNYGFQIRLNFNRTFYKLYMLKRQNTYMFLIQTKKDGSFSLLNGGSLKSVPKKDLSYFYDRIPNYAMSIKMFLNEYLSLQKKIANDIKAIGGSGFTHGCIVDIDYYNHLYINPLDGTITPYYATSMVSKYAYSNICSLLKYHAPDFYSNYLKLIESKNDVKKFSVIPYDTSLVEKYVYVTDTDIYRISRIIRGLQFITNYSIIRIWNSDIAENPSNDSGKLIVSDILKK